MYYLALNGAQSGPFPLEHLRAGWKSGELREETLYWQDGMPEWLPLGSIRPLLEEAGAPATPAAAVATNSPGMVIGGFWRRVAAFLIDVLLLGLIGFGSGFFLFRFYMSLGVAGILVGLIIATAYFGLLSSRLGGGQTLGQRLFGLRVVDAHGLTISPGRSIARYLVLAFPFFLNKALSDGLVGGLWLGALLMIPVIAGFLSLTYLLIFNRGTRQLVHDWATGTYVVRTISTQPATAPIIWRGHLIAVAIICLAAVVLSCLLPLAVALPIFRETYAIRQRLLDTGVVQAATVTGGTAVAATTGRVDSMRVLTLLVHLKGPPLSSPVVAAHLAGIALRNDPVVSSYNRIDVSVSWGYDIGIASGVVTDQYRHTPAEWQALAAQP